MLYEVITKQIGPGDVAVIAEFTDNGRSPVMVQEFQESSYNFV